MQCSKEERRNELKYVLALYNKSKIQQSLETLSKNLQDFEKLGNELSDELETNPAANIDRNRDQWEDLSELGEKASELLIPVEALKNAFSALEEAITSNEF